MPRAPRNIAAGICYHVLNRGNERRPIFRKARDYEAFLEILTEALRRFDVELLCWCLMPNHWYLVLRPRSAKALAAFMRWLSVTHVRRHHEHYHSDGGHLYQGRYKSFPVEEDEYFLVLCRYIEANALRASLVELAEQWAWSSLSQRIKQIAYPPMREWPVEQPRLWVQIVNEAMPTKQAEQVRTSIARDRPLGSEPWTRKIAARLGLQQTLRPRGRPQKPLS